MNEEIRALRVDLLRAGEEKEWSQAVRCVGPKIFVYFREQNLVDEPQFQDLRQLVLAKLFRRVTSNGVSDAEHFFFLTLKIAHDEAVDYIRKISREHLGQQLIHQELKLDYACSDNATLTDEILYGDLIGRFTSLCDELFDPPMPTILHERILGGLSLQELSDKYGIPISTLYDKINSALREIRHQLER